MRECDNSKIHISSKFILSICLLLMFITLQHLATLTTLHFTILSTLYFLSFTLHYSPIWLNGYPTNAPSPLKSPTYERTKKFKCSVHSCGSLLVITALVVSTLYNGLWSDSRSGRLPNNVLMNVMNNIF